MCGLVNETECSCDIKRHNGGHFETVVSGGANLLGIGAIFDLDGNLVTDGQLGHSGANFRDNTGTSLAG